MIRSLYRRVSQTNSYIVSKFVLFPQLPVTVNAKKGRLRQIRLSARRDIAGQHHRYLISAQGTLSAIMPVLACRRVKVCEQC